jgi:uncharacterized membrane protein YgaE (UPF0421/DUF939 family)
MTDYIEILYLKPASAGFLHYIHYLGIMKTKMLPILILGLLAIAGAMIAKHYSPNLEDFLYGAAIGLGIGLLVSFVLLQRKRFAKK